MGVVIDGKSIASEIQRKIAEEIRQLKWDGRVGGDPKLAVVLVGHDPASRIYVERKRKVCEEIGIRGEIHEFPSDSTQEEIEDFVRSLADGHVRQADGILVQLPLPIHLDKNRILNAVPPDKDVDCFNAVNIGRLAQGTAKLLPCTPAGIIEILKYHKIPTQGRRVTIINRSLVVGQPLSVMLSQEPYNATVTVVHEHTEDLYSHTRDADIIITAVGKYPKFHLPVKAIVNESPIYTVKKDVVIIDVAMNREGNHLFGDVVEFDAMKERCSYITPVPNGVGPCTISMLMKNTLIAAKMRRSKNTDTLTAIGDFTRRYS